MATDQTETLDLNPTEMPVIFGLWQLVPSGESDKPPTESQIMKYMVRGFELISMPITYLFYMSKEINFKYTRLQHIYIILLTLIIPASLFCLNFYYLANNIPVMPTRPTGSIPTKPADIRPEPVNTTWETYDANVKPWNEYDAKLTARTDRVQDRTIIYMVCMWMSMFALMVLFFPRLQDVSE